MKFRQFKTQLYKKYPSDIIVVNKYWNHIYIGMIAVKEVNKGHGTSIMKDICDFCDENNIWLQTYPTDQHGSDLQRLIKWCERFGFKYLDNSDEMVKMPLNSRIRGQHLNAIHIDAKFTGVVGNYMDFKDYPIF